MELNHLQINKDAGSITLNRYKETLEYIRFLSNCRFLWCLQEAPPALTGRADGKSKQVPPQQQQSGSVTLSSSPQQRLILSGDLYNLTTGRSEKFCPPADKRALTPRAPCRCLSSRRTLKSDRQIERKGMFITSRDTLTSGVHLCIS